MRIASPRRLFAIAQAFYRDDFTLEEVYQMTKIDHWFLGQMERITDMAKELKSTGKTFTPEQLRKAKVLGFADSEIARLTGITFKEVYDLRRKHGVLPITNQIDTLAAEFPAQTNYLYTTYLGVKDDV